MQEIRTGKISTIDKVKGVARVVYEDKDNAVSAELPIMCNGIYQLPKIGDTVLVAHLPNGSSSGVIVGKIFNKGNLPAANIELERYKKLEKTVEEQGKRIKTLEDKVKALGG